MLFDVDPRLVKKLAREARVGKRDVTIRPARLGPNHVTYVSAKTEEGLDFVMNIRERLPEITSYEGDDEDERDDEGDDSDDDE